MKIYLFRWNESLHVQALLSMCAQPAEDGQMEMY